MQGGGDGAAFQQILGEVIYEPLLNAARNAGRETQVRTAFVNPHSLAPGALSEANEFIAGNYATTSVYQLAQILNTPANRNRDPAAVITLNYDTLLFALQRILETQEYRQANPGSAASYPPARYRQVVTSLDHGPDKIPIFHIHGCLPPGRTAQPGSIVAEEDVYFELVQRSSSWPQTTFLYHAQNTTLLFVGQSLADGNMRRWLAWEHARVSDEHRYYMQRAAVTPQPPMLKPRHWWIHRGPTSPDARALIASGVLHLGVNVAWISSWNDVGATVRHLLNM